MSEEGEKDVPRGPSHEGDQASVSQPASVTDSTTGATGSGAGVKPSVRFTASVVEDADAKDEAAAEQAVKPKTVTIKVESSDDATNELTSLSAKATKPRRRSRAATAIGGQGGAPLPSEQDLAPLEEEDGESNVDAADEDAPEGESQTMQLLTTGDSSSRSRGHSVSGSTSSSAIKSMRASRGAAAKLMSRIGRKGVNARHLKTGTGMFGLMKKLTTMQRALLDYDSRAFHAGAKPESILKRILDKTPEQRRITDINFISEIVKEVKFFKQLDPGIRQSLLRVVKYLRIGRKGMVFRQGAIGDKFYIIFTGLVNIYVRHDMPEETPPEPKTEGDGEGKEGGEEEEEDEEAAAERLAKEAALVHTQAGTGKKKGKKGKSKGKGKGKKKKKKAKGKDDSTSATVDVQDDDDYDYAYSDASSDSSAEEEYLRYELSELGNMVAELGQGFAFGELALINQEPRNATIICKERTEFIVVERDDYNRILREEHRKAMKLKQEYLLGISVLSKCSKKYINAISYFFKPREVMRGQILFRQGDNPENIYFIKSGECKVSHQGEITYDQFAYPVPIETRVMKLFDIAEIGKFQMFGVLSALDNVPQPYTIQTRTDCEIFEVERDDFRKKFSRKVVGEFREVARMRHERWQARYERQRDLAQQGVIVPRALTHDKIIRTSVSNKGYTRPRQFARGEKIDEDDAIAIGEARDHDFKTRSEKSAVQPESRLLVMTPRKGKLLQANNTMSPRHSKAAEVALARRRRTDFDPKTMVWNAYAPDKETASRVERALASAAQSIVKLRPADALPVDDEALSKRGGHSDAGEGASTTTPRRPQSAISKSVSAPDMRDPQRPRSAIAATSTAAAATPRAQRPHSARTQGMPHRSLTGVTGPNSLVESPERVVYGGDGEFVRSGRPKSAGTVRSSRTRPQSTASSRVGASTVQAERLRLDLSKLNLQFEDVPDSGVSHPPSYSTTPHRPASSARSVSGRRGGAGVNAQTGPVAEAIRMRQRPVSARPRLQANERTSGFAPGRRPGSARSIGGQHAARPPSSARSLRTSARPASQRSILKARQREDAEAGIIEDDGESEYADFATGGRQSSLSRTAPSGAAYGSSSNTRRRGGAPTKRPVSGRSRVSFGEDVVDTIGPSSRFDAHRQGIAEAGDVGKIGRERPQPSKPPLSRPGSATIAFGRTLSKQDIRYAPKAVQIANETPKERADRENKAPFKKKKKKIVPIHEQQYRSRFSRYEDSQALNVVAGLSPSNYSRQESEATLQQILMAKARASQKTGQYKSRWKV